MANNYRRSADLYVEGKNDLMSIANLLEAHAFQQVGSVRDVQIHDQKGVTPLLDIVETAVKGSTGRARGFVIDADDSAKSAWTAIRQRIENATEGSTALPSDCPANGWVGDVDYFKSRIGIWIMPDNTAPGFLEDFLQTIVPAGDILLPIARTATDAAQAAGAKFPDVAKPKAVVHTWLAWQETPGNPYGTAIKSKYFDPSAVSAQQFIQWVRRLVD